MDVCVCVCMCVQGMVHGGSPACGSCGSCSPAPPCPPGPLWPPLAACLLCHLPPAHTHCTHHMTMEQNCNPKASAFGNFKAKKI